MRTQISSCAFHEFVFLRRNVHTRYRNWRRHLWLLLCKEGANSVIILPRVDNFNSAASLTIRSVLVYVQFIFSFPFTVFSDIKWLTRLIIYLSMICFGMIFFDYKRNYITNAIQYFLKTLRNNSQPHSLAQK